MKYHIFHKVSKTKLTSFLESEEIYQFKKKFDIKGFCQ